MNFEDCERKLKYFGTDGFRGRFGEELLPRHARLIGEFLGWLYGEGAKILIGRDTRESSPILERELARGAGKFGARAFSAGVITTAAVSYLTVRGDFDVSVMITASHNPHTDNGIKLIGRSGEKLDDSILQKAEEYVDAHFASENEGSREANTEETAESSESNDAAYSACEYYRQGYEEYKSLLISVSEELCGLRIGLDCANGSASKIAPDVFTCLGASVYTVASLPDGKNINRAVGSTHIEALRQLVISEGLDMGFAFDGDGDRCIAVDGDGEIIDGDRELLILARQLKSQGRLPENKIAVTVMSNGGLTDALRSDGISCETTAVGDKYVLEAMKKQGLNLGGEQSGHVIIRDILPTGDGIITALLLASAAAKHHASLRLLSKDFRSYPQISESIAVKDKEKIMNDSSVKDFLSSIKQEMEHEGRLLIRKSGTESLIRIMTEHESYKKCKQYVAKIADYIRKKDEERER